MERTFPFLVHKLVLGYLFSLGDFDKKVWMLIKETFLALVVLSGKDSSVTNVCVLLIGPPLQTMHCGWDDSAKQVAHTIESKELRDDCPLSR